MSEEKDKTIASIGQAVTELRTLVEEVSEKSLSYDETIEKMGGEQKTKAEAIEKELAKLDEAQTKFVSEEASKAKDVKELTERCENLEMQLVKGSKGDVLKLKETPQYKAFKELSQKGSFDKVGLEHKDILRTDIGSQGGFLVPEVLAGDVIKKIEEISPVRSFARVRTLNAKTVNIPIRNSVPEAKYEGEAETGEDSISDYSSEGQTAHRCSVTVPITNDLLQFAGFDMETEILQDVATGFAKKEGNKFVLGSGVKQPEGFIERAGTGPNDVPFVETAGSGVVSMDDVINLSGEQKIGYNSVYGFARKTVNTLRVERDSNGNYLWTFGGERFPTVINGFDYILLQDMPAIAVGNFPVVFADFFNGYNILDAIAMEMVRDPFSRKRDAIVEFTWHTWNDGRVVLAEAFQLLKVKA